MLLSCSCPQSTPRQAVSQVESKWLNLVVPLNQAVPGTNRFKTTNNFSMSSQVTRPFLLFAKSDPLVRKTINNSACPFQVIGRLQFSGNKKACPLWTRRLAVLRSPVAQNETGKRPLITQRSPLSASPSCRHLCISYTPAFISSPHQLQFMTSPRRARLLSP